MEEENQDPYVMYLIVRESINMSIGKTAAQCAHASQMLQLKFDQLRNSSKIWNPPTIKDFYQSNNIIINFEQWISNSFRKVVLKADEKEWEKIKQLIPDSERILVVDAGLTELAPSTETVIGLFPMKKSERLKIIKKLQVLK